MLDMYGADIGVADVSIRRTVLSMLSSGIVIYRRWVSTSHGRCLLSFPDTRR